MKLKLPKNPNWEKYNHLAHIEGEPIDPRCPYCEADGQYFGFYHITKKWVYYVCFECQCDGQINEGVFRYPRNNYKQRGLSRKGNRKH